MLPPGATHPRVATVIGAAFDKRASARNKIKRLCYEVARALLPKLPVCDMIIMPLREAKDAPSEELRADIRNLLASNPSTLTPLP